MADSWECELWNLKRSDILTHPWRWHGLFAGRMSSVCDYLYLSNTWTVELLSGSNFWWLSGIRLPWWVAYFSYQSIAMITFSEWPYKWRLTHDFLLVFTNLLYVVIAFLLIPACFSVCTSKQSIQWHLLQFVNWRVKTNTMEHFVLISLVIIYK